MVLHGKQKEYKHDNLKMNIVISFYHTKRKTDWVINAAKDLSNNKYKNSDLLVLSHALPFLQYLKNYGSIQWPGQTSDYLSNLSPFFPVLPWAITPVSTKPLSFCKSLIYFLLSLPCLAPSLSCYPHLDPPHYLRLLPFLLEFTFQAPFYLFGTVTLSRNL